MTKLAGFPNGYSILSNLISAANGRFYSSVAFSGHVPPVIEIFSVGAGPNDLRSYSQRSQIVHFTQNLPDETLLGVAVDQAANRYSLVTSDLEGRLTTVYRFPSGEQLPGTAIFGADGSYYGVSWEQKAGTGGYVYKVTPAGSLTKIYSLPAPSFATGFSSVPLIQGTDGNLYGAAPAGSGNGSDGFGTVYQLSTAGRYTLLHRFTKGTETGPESLIQASDGNLYGTTRGFDGPGEIFRITPSGVLTALYEMRDADGLCPCHLMQGSDGMLYGSANGAGPQGTGTVFALDAGLPKPAPRVLRFQPSSGAVGTKVLIWGYNLLSALVRFHGVAATTVSGSGPNYVWATVPAGVKSGPIQMATPGGSAASATNFTLR